MRMTRTPLLVAPLAALAALPLLSLTAHPALVVATPVADRVDLNTSVLGVVPFAAGAGTALGGSLGLGSPLASLSADPLIR